MLCLFAFLGTFSSFTVVPALLGNLSQTFAFAAAGTRTFQDQGDALTLDKKDLFRAFLVLSAPPDKVHKQA